MGRIRRKRQRLIRLVSLLLLAAAILIIIVVFQVKTVVVMGNVRRSGQEIAEDLSYDFLTQNTLFLMWKHRNGGALERLPYLSSLKLKLDSPGKITVTVTEKELVGCIYGEDQNLYFDEDGIILEISDKVYDGILAVTGVKMGEPVLYQKVPTESSAQLRTILSITQLLKYQGLSAQEIRFADNMDITVRIGNVDAALGQDEYLEEKIANLRAILEVMSDSSGTLHMENFTGKNEPVSFSEGEIPDPVIGEKSTEEESSSGQEEQTEDEGQPDDGENGENSADDTQEEGGAQENGENTDDGAGDDVSVPEDAGVPADGTDEAANQEAGDTPDEAGDDGQEEEPQDDPSTYFMVFDSSGTLRYDAHVVDGVVVDANGNPIDGCTVTEDGNVKDAYWNVIDPATGQLAQ